MLDYNNVDIEPLQEPNLNKVLERMASGIYAADPALWVKDALGYDLDQWQKEAMRVLFLGKRYKEDAVGLGRVSIRAGHGVGKTLLASIIAHYFLMNFVPSKVAITGPTGQQTRRQIWSYIHTVWRRSVFRDQIAWQATRVCVKGAEEEWNIVWMTSREPKHIEGYHGPLEGRNLLWIIEEAKGVQDAVFEAISGALSHEDNYWYVSSTCGPPRGMFYDTHHSLRHLWDTIHIPSTASPRVSMKQIEMWKRQWGEDSPIYKARVLAEFPEDEDQVICPLSWCMRAVEEQEEALA